MKHSLLTVMVIMAFALIAHFSEQHTQSIAIVDAELVPPLVVANPPPDDKDKHNNFVFPGLETRDSRRSFYGAPPVVPHRIGKTDRECLTCHSKPTEFQGHISPPSPHPEYVNCQQCHVRGDGPVIFNETVTLLSNWAPMTEPKLGSRNHPFAPPTIPHRLHMRDNCAACHNEQHPNPDTRVQHSSRVNCVQCHVPDYQQSSSPFSHEFSE